MAEKLLDQIKVFEVYYALGVNRSLSKLSEELHRRYKSGIPSEGTLKKWSGRFKWQNKIVIRDNAAYEGVAEKMTEAMVDTKVRELEQLDHAFLDIEKLKPLIFSALDECLGVDPKTGKKRLEIIPQTTQDMTALYNAMSRLNTTQVKIVETARKIRGESDNIKVTGSVNISLDETLKEYEDVIKRITASNPVKDDS